MSRIRNILVVVDPTAAEQTAIAKAALLAEEFNARLELFACETNASRELRLASHLRERPAAPFVVNLKAMIDAAAWDGTTSMRGDTVPTYSDPTLQPWGTLCALLFE